MITKRWVYLFLLIGLLMLFTPLVLAEETHSASSATAGGTHGVDGAKLPLWSIIPFIGILLSIAIIPLVRPEFYHHHYGKVAATWALIFAIPYVIIYRSAAIYDILHIYLIDYIPFIILLWGLFTVSGGILVRGTLQGKPVVNTVMLLIGTIIASWVGTTGAAMLLIRPMLRANANRQKKMHIVIFFIFLVCNIGGSLTPLGDPPLFLGFLHGVPFFWTTTNLFIPMVFISIILLVIFFIFDTLLYRREKSVQDDAPPPTEREPLGVDGLFNLIFLAGIVAAVLMSGMVKLGEYSIFGVHLQIQNNLRDLIILTMGGLSLIFSPVSGKLRQSNSFTWFPIAEVGKVFAGIFMTIIPALAILQAGERGALDFLVKAVKEPMHYFWVTGVLSSFLDNAPTYLTFFNSALGKLHLTEPHITEFLRGTVPAGVQLAQLDRFVEFLTAISIGAVFMGANTYIGNAPNFMVRSIAEENDIKMPSFFGYMLWSIVILVPIFVVVTFVFFR